MKKEKKASVLIYSIVLTSIALILGVVVMNNHLSLIINKENIDTERKLYQNIRSNININSDLELFVDNISCPGYSTWSSLITMSWTTIRADIQSTLSQSWWIVFCMGNYNSKDLEIYFNSNYDWFSNAKYDDQTISLGWTTNLTGNFTTDNTTITIPINSYNISDWFDDNFNNNYVRKTITWFISPWLTKNIFWNNYNIESYININTNNNDNLNIKLWDVTNWFLNLEVNGESELKVIRIDKDRYTNFKEFEKTLTLTWTINSWSGYIKYNWSNLELSTTMSWAYSFDFKKDIDPNKWHDYILMLKNLEDDRNINYTIKWTNNDLKWIYLNPIDDSNSNDKWFKILWYDIIINDKWNILWKMIEKVWGK